MSDTPPNEQRPSSNEDMARKIMEKMQRDEESERPVRRRPQGSRPSGSRERPEGARRRPDGSRSSGERSRSSSGDARRNRSSSGKKSSGSRKRSDSDRRSRERAAERGSSKGVIIAVLVTLIILLLIGLGIYLFWFFHGMREAQDKFLPNTFINDIEVSNMNETEAYRALTRKSDDTADSLVFIKLDGSKTVIPFSDIGYKDNIKATITKLMDGQNYYNWNSAKNKRTDYTFDTAYTYDKVLLKSELKRRIIDASGKLEPKDAFVKYTNGSFEIVKEQKGDKIDESKLDELMTHVEDCFKHGILNIDLSEMDLYYQPKVLAADLEEDLESFRKMDRVRITFDFVYEEAELTGTEFMKWIEFKDNNALKGFTVNRDKAMKYVEGLAAKYDTYNTKRHFKSTTRGDIIVDQGRGNYGWWIDQEKMCDLVIKLIKEGKSKEKVQPVYYVNPNCGYEYSCDRKYRTAESDIGNTYCEVDLAKQHFWYYENGVKKYECDIVSGKPTEERNTPAGVYCLWLKQKNKVLTGSNSAGESWTTPVAFWNDISTIGVGLHDANWHPYFGGDRYKYDGSHGCINMPYSAAKYVYENVPLDTPVIMYW